LKKNGKIINFEIKYFAMGGKKRVLIVDDSVFTLEQLKSIVEKTGIAEVVGHAKDGMEGIKKYRDLAPDVVFLDILMPNMDGLQTLRAIMNMDKNAKVVMISSLEGAAEKAEESLKFGAKAIISKPFNEKEIKDILEKL
jgi:two-component system chemotaxis response regulator CheY